MDLQGTVETPCFEIIKSLMPLILGGKGTQAGEMNHIIEKSRLQSKTKWLSETIPLWAQQI